MGGKGVKNDWFFVIWGFEEKDIVSLIVYKVDCVLWCMGFFMKIDFDVNICKMIYIYYWIVEVKRFIFECILLMYFIILYFKSGFLLIGMWLVDINYSMYSLYGEVNYWNVWRGVKKMG